MINLDVKLLRRCLLAGSGASDIDELLRTVSIEELVLQLSLLDDDRFLDDEDDSAVVPIIDDRYVGTLLVRVLDLLLNEQRLQQLFQNNEVLDLLSQRVATGCLPVRRLVAKKCASYSIGQVNHDGRLTELIWELLFDQDYRVFEKSSEAILSVIKGSEGFFNEKRVGDLMERLESSYDSEHVLPVRLFEFCSTLGVSSTCAFGTMLSAGLYGRLFDIFMSSDFLVKLNILEILERNPEFLKRLHEVSQIPQNFISQLLFLLTAGDNISAEESLLAPYVCRILVSMFSNGLLGTEANAALTTFVSQTMISSNPQKADVNLCTALGCFGRLYISGSISNQLCLRLEEILRTTTQEDVISSAINSLSFISEHNLNGEQIEFLSGITKTLLKALSRFALSEVLGFDGMLELVLNEELETRLFSSQENLYATTVAKKRLVKELIRRAESMDSCEAGTPIAECISALKEYLLQG